MLEANSFKSWEIRGKIMNNAQKKTQNQQAKINKLGYKALKNVVKKPKKIEQI